MRGGVEELERLNELRQSGKIQWSENAHAWAAQPRDVVEALAHAGFAEYKLVVTRSRRDRPPTGCVWQGLNLQTGPWRQRSGCNALPTLSRSSSSTSTASSSTATPDERSLAWRPRPRNGLPDCSNRRCRIARPLPLRSASPSG